MFRTHREMDLDERTGLGIIDLAKLLPREDDDNPMKKKIQSAILYFAAAATILTGLATGYNMTNPIKDNGYNHDYVNPEAIVKSGADLPAANIPYLLTDAYGGQLGCNGSAGECVAKNSQPAPSSYKGSSSSAK